MGTTNVDICQPTCVSCCKCDKVFKSGPSKICGRQPLKNLKGYEGMIWFEVDHIPSKILKAVFHKF